MMTSSVYVLVFVMPTYLAATRLTADIAMSWTTENTSHDDVIGLCVPVAAGNGEHRL